MNSECHPAQSSVASLGLPFTTGAIFLNVWKASSHTAHNHKVFAAPVNGSMIESREARSLNKKPKELFYPKPASARERHSPATYPFLAPPVPSNSVHIHHAQGLQCNTTTNPCVIPLTDSMVQHQAPTLARLSLFLSALTLSRGTDAHFSFCLAWSPILTLSVASYAIFQKSSKSQF